MLKQSELEETTHAAGVKARTLDGFAVAEPITITIDGQETKLSVADASRLSAGLLAAVETIQASNGHTVLFGTTRDGMSYTSANKTKLPFGPEEVDAAVKNAATMMASFNLKKVTISQDLSKLENDRVHGHTFMLGSKTITAVQDLSTLKTNTDTDPA